MGSMTIRTAVIEDLDEIVEIYNQAISAGQRTADTTPFSVQDRVAWFEDHSADQYPVLVAEDEGTVVGYLTISPYRPGREALRHTAEVSYYIHFSHHRKGIASALLEYAIGMCPSLGIKTLFGILLDSNEGSIRLMEKFGFEKWGHLPRVAEYDGFEAGHLYYGLRICAK